MAVLLETSRWVPWKMDLHEKDFMRIADLTAIAFAITAITLLVTNLYESLFLLTEWLPIIVFLLISAQIYSSAQATPLKAIAASVRRRNDEHADNSLRPVDLRLPYFFITLIATSIAAAKSQTFYILMCVLLLWAFWPLRSRRYNPLTWLSMTGSAFIVGFGILTGISQLQGMVQEFTTQWFQADWSQRNMQRNSTAMGQIGRLKLSEQIFMRIQSNYGTDILLQQASYNRFSGITWHATGQQYRQVEKSGSTNRFLLSSNAPETGDELTISSYLIEGEGILALPLGSYAIENQRDGKLFTNEFGAARIEQKNTLLDFKVYYRKEFQNSLKPTHYDLEVPNTYQKLLKGIADELGLKQLPPGEAAEKLQDYFRTNFQYSLIQDSSSLVLNPLSTFLTSVRKGHCEYFATAGALILRAAGIPTRYAAGYLMSEMGPDTNQYIVRSRHAHAWTLAYIDNQWTELDYTPPTWATMESEAAPWWQGIYDIASNSKHFFYQWWNAKPRSPENYVLLLVLLLAAFIVLRKFKPIHFRLQWQKQQPIKHQQINSKENSPFYKIVRHLDRSVLARKDGETIKQWVRRIPNLNHEQQQKLDQLVQQHYQYRFSSQGGNDPCLETFNNEVEKWLNTTVN